MSTLRPISTTVLSLITGLALVLFGTSCTKHDDDCAKPRSVVNNGTADTRIAPSATSGPVTAGPRAGLQQKDLGTGPVDNTGGAGISDDGDSETDGEHSNKKGKH